MRFRFTFDIPVAVNNIKMFSVATEKQQWDSFAISTSYKIFRTAVKSTQVFGASYTVSDTKIRSVREEFINADRTTDMSKLTGTLATYAKEPEMYYVIQIYS